jgi:hypothetical protein
VFLRRSRAHRHVIFKLRTVFSHVLQIPYIFRLCTRHKEPSMTRQSNN